MLAIVKNHPSAAHDVETRGERVIKYPFRDLGVGDCFFVIDRNDFNSVRALASKNSRKDKKFTARMHGESLRVSRIC